MKTKPRFLQLKARLEVATDVELLTELMKRVVSKGGVTSCYFVDRLYGGGWEIHRAGEKSIIITKGEEE